jgi:hypothetical protein
VAPSRPNAMTMAMTTITTSIGIVVLRRFSEAW